MLCGRKEAMKMIEYLLNNGRVLKQTAITIEREEGFNRLIGFSRASAGCKIVVTEKVDKADVMIVAMVFLLYVMKSGHAPNFSLLGAQVWMAMLIASGNTCMRKLLSLILESWLSWLEARNNELGLASEGSGQQKAALRLLSVIKLINQAVGDALSCLLSVEAILQQKGQSCRQNSCPVATTNAETVAIRPPGIQEAIDAETVKYPKGRCFIRPSGTEDDIRVYAEASTQEAADSLAKSIAKIVDRFLGFGTSRQ
ncbi:hypothetical protein PVK06_000578 [Gossypium arboreum]|uniref:Phosphoacetylglucosamine mutase n=1 Tax=Gossypium arboreum TaxID=29729 RepID=A0ABR0QYY4_GOSAR|nr:hypothetical protein PVK06_000578 [Gossypium arboreum]